MMDFFITKSLLPTVSESRSSVAPVTRLQAGKQRNCGQIPDSGKILFFPPAGFRQSLEPTDPQV